MVTVNRENQEEHLRNGISRSRNVSGISEENTTLVFEVTEGKEAKKISQEFSKTENRILGVLSNLDEFILNSQVLLQSRNVPGTSKGIQRKYQEPDEDSSQNDLHPDMKNTEIGTHCMVITDPNTVLHCTAACCLLDIKFNSSVVGNFCSE